MPRLMMFAPPTLRCAPIRPKPRGGGTAVRVSRASPSTIALSDPGSPFAMPMALVAAPTVDLANEAVQQLVARYSFAANAAVIRAEDKMTKSLFDLKV